MGILRECALRASLQGMEAEGDDRRMMFRKGGLELCVLYQGNGAAACAPGPEAEEGRREVMRFLGAVEEYTHRVRQGEEPEQSLLRGAGYRIIERARGGFVLAGRPPDGENGLHEFLTCRVNLDGEIEDLLYHGAFYENAVADLCVRGRLYDLDPRYTVRQAQALRSAAVFALRFDQGMGNARRLTLQQDLPAWEHTPLGIREEDTWTPRREPDPREEGEQADAVARWERGHRNPDDLPLTAWNRCYGGAGVANTGCGEKVRYKYEEIEMARRREEAPAPAQDVEQHSGPMAQL